jgi:hypothetical protein
MFRILFFLFFGFVSFAYAGEVEVFQCAKKKLSNIQNASYWNETYSKGQKHLEIMNPTDFLQTGDVLIEPMNEFNSGIGDEEVMKNLSDDPANYLNTIKRFNEGWTHAIIVYRDPATSEVFLMDSEISGISKGPYSDDDVQAMQAFPNREQLLKILNNYRKEKKLDPLASKSDISDDLLKASMYGLTRSPEIRAHLIRERLRRPDFMDGAKQRVREKTQSNLDHRSFVVLRPRKDIENRPAVLEKMGKHLGRLFSKDILFNVKSVEAYAEVNNDPSRLVSQSTADQINQSYESDEQLLKHCTERVVDSLVIGGVRKVFAQPSLVKNYLEQVEAIQKQRGPKQAEKLIKLLNKKIQLSILVSAYGDTNDYLNFAKVDEMKEAEIDKHIQDFTSKLSMVDGLMFSSLTRFMALRNKAALAHLEGLLLAGTGGSFFPNVFYNDLTTKSTFSENNPKGGVFSYAGSINACKAEAHGIKVETLNRSNSGWEVIEITTPDGSYSSSNRTISSN